MDKKNDKQVDGGRIGRLFWIISLTALAFIGLALFYTTDNKSSNSIPTVKTDPTKVTKNDGNTSNEETSAIVVGDSNIVTRLDGREVHVTKCADDKCLGYVAETFGVITKYKNGTMTYKNGDEDSMTVNVGKDDTITTRSYSMNGSKEVIKEEAGTMNDLAEGSSVIVIEEEGRTTITVVK